MTANTVYDLAKLSLIIFMLPILSESQAQSSTFDIVRSDLVYFNSQSRSNGDPGSIFGRFSTSTAIPVILQPVQFVEENREKHDHAKHYNKGNLKRVRNRKRQFRLNSVKTAKRQGQRCPGVCRYIPDRDFCPTNVVVVPVRVEEEIKSYDEDYYSDETSLEDSSEEYYDEEDYNVLRVTRRLTQPNQQRNGSAPGVKVLIKSQNGKLYVVNSPITRFSLSRAHGNNSYRIRSTQGRLARRRSRKRPAPNPQIKFRQPALEQEIIIRWDRVVERGPFIGGDVVVPDGVQLRPPNFRFIRKLWPNAEIPFTVDPALNSCRQNAIFDAMDEIEEKTCVRFVDRERDRNYIDIRLTQVGCSSYVGMVGGVQHLNLSTGCFSKFTVLHELMHSLGFDHEQSRRDRDKFIDIDFDNVLNEKESQFELNPDFSGAGFPYDIRSIMHYSAFLFAKDNCEPTIYPVDEKVDICVLGTGNGKGGMTDCDAAKINKMYKCTGRKYPNRCKVRN